MIGTAGKGLCNTPYQVTDRALAAQQFGFSGTLERGIEECASNSDNILAFRCGTKAMVLTVSVMTPPPGPRLLVSPSPFLTSPPMRAPATVSGTRPVF